MKSPKHNGLQEPRRLKNLQRNRYEYRNTLLIIKMYLLNHTTYSSMFIEMECQ